EPERVPGITPSMLHFNMVQEITQGIGQKQLLVIAVSPNYHDLPEGTIGYEKPCRIKLWSPAVELPNVGWTRVYRWTHADFWFAPERLPIESADAGRIAWDDILGAVIALTSDPATLGSGKSIDPSQSAADYLQRECFAFS